MKRKENVYLTCPECSSVEILVYEETAWKLLVNGDFEHYCQSVKLHDAEAESRCLDCNWTGSRSNLLEWKDERI